jgi:hypothetical protein
MTRDQARTFALSLPEATEQPHFEMWSFRVRGKIFATVTPDGRHLHVFVDDATVRAAVGSDPAAFEELWWGKKLAGVRVKLSSAKSAAVLDLLEASWRRKASKHLTASLTRRTIRRFSG